MTDATAATGVDAPPLSIWTKLAYGFGSVAYGVKDNGFGYFLLMFYGTVIGLEPGLVGLAIFLALVADAFSDPIMGYVSDNWRSKWGRRHPFMYFSAVPVAVSYYFLWNPPDLGQAGLFWYLLTLAILIRTFITFYATPSSALMPELSRGYEERTSLQAYRLYFGWTGGNLVTVLMYGVLFAMFAKGQNDPEAYKLYGFISAVLIFTAIIVSSWGTHHRIKTFSPPPPKRKISIFTLFKEVFQTLGDPSFFALFLATLFGAIASGISAALAFLLLTHFWEFSEVQIFLWTALVFVSAIGGFIIGPMMVKRFGKKRSVIYLGIVAFTMAPMPVILRLMGLMPENSDPILFPIVMAVNTIDLALIIALQAVLYSMIADLVEQSELKTGRRSEGVFFAAITFTRKSNQGLGAFSAGLILSLVSFPTDQPARGTVPDDVLWNLGAFYAPTLLALWTCMIIAVSFYKIDKADHEENLRKLKAIADAKV